MSTMTAAQAGKALEYGIVRRVRMPYEQALERVTATLKEQGFGILTEIDVKKTMKAKLDVDFTKYIILGACNPPLAHRALTAEIDLGLLLPCNVVVYEDEKAGETVVSTIKPEMLVQVTGNPELEAVAKEVETKLTAAIDAV